MHPRINQIRPATIPTPGRKASIMFLSPLSHLLYGQGKVKKLPQAMKNPIIKSFITYSLNQFKTINDPYAQ